MEVLIVWVIVIVFSIGFNAISNVRRRKKVDESLGLAKTQKAGVSQEANPRRTAQPARQHPSPKQSRLTTTGNPLGYQQQPYYPQSQPYAPQSQPYAPQSQPFTPQSQYLPEEGQRVTDGRARIMESAKPQPKLDLAINDREQLKRAIILGEILQPKF